MLNVKSILDERGATLDQSEWLNSLFWVICVELKCYSINKLIFVYHLCFNTFRIFNENSFYNFRAEGVFGGVIPHLPEDPDAERKMTAKERAYHYSKL